MTNYFPGHAGIMPAHVQSLPDRKVAFVMYGEPKSKERPRVNQKTGNVYTPKATKDAEKEIAIQYKAETDMFFEGFVELRLTFYLGTRRERDGDNMAKLVQDALNGVAYTDDKRIRRLIVDVIDTTKERARTEVTIVEISKPVEYVGG